MNLEKYRLGIEKKKKQKKKSKSKFPIAIIGAIIIGVIVFYFYSADQAKIRGFAFGNEFKNKKRFKMNKENLFQVLQNGMKKQSQMTR